MNKRISFFVVALFCVVGCEPTPAEKPDSKVASEGTKPSSISKSNTGSAPKVAGKSGWELTYDGDINGKLIGHEVAGRKAGLDYVVVGTKAKMVDKKLVMHSVTFTAYRNKDKTIRGGAFRFDLPGKVQCVLDAAAVKHEILDSSETSFHVKFEGKGDCKGNKINVKGFLQNG